MVAMDKCHFCGKMCYTTEEITTYIIYEQGEVCRYSKDYVVAHKACVRRFNEKTA